MKKMQILVISQISLVTVGANLKVRQSEGGAEAPPLLIALDSEFLDSEFVIRHGSISSPQVSHSSLAFYLFHLLGKTVSTFPLLVWE